MVYFLRWGIWRERERERNGGVMVLGLGMRVMQLGVEGKSGIGINQSAIHQSFTYPKKPPSLAHHVPLAAGCVILDTLIRLFSLIKKKRKKRKKREKTNVQVRYTAKSSARAVSFLFWRKVSRC